MGISSGLDIAMRALMAQQAAVDTASHNVANARTPGFSRQRVQMQSVPGVTHTGAGAGVELQATRRVRDLFADFQWRSANEQLGKFDATATSLHQIEMALNEPGDGGLRAVLSQFFSAWGDLANQPESSAARISVMQAGNSLAVTAQRLQTSLSGIRDDADGRIRNDLAEANLAISKIASLNEQISVLQAGGNEASDLRDARDLAMDQLSRLVDAQFQDRPNGTVDIFIGGHSVVQGVQAFPLEGTPNAMNSNYLDISFASDGAPARIRGGSIGALLVQRDTDLPARMADLDALVGQIIADVNAVHSAGYGLDGVTGRDFFTGTDASNVAVSATVRTDPNTIAASSSAAGVPGNAEQAAAISDLQYAKPLLAGTGTYSSFWDSFVSGVGAASSEATLLSQSQDSVVQQIDQLRQSTSGVNLDEELVTLTGYQRAYEAAARLVTVLDEMLDTLVNRTL